MSYLRRLQVITQSVNWTAYKPHFAKETNLKQLKTCALNSFTARGNVHVFAATLKHIQHRTKCVHNPAVVASELNVRCNVAMSFTITGIEWERHVGGSSTSFISPRSAIF